MKWQFHWNILWYIAYPFVSLIDSCSWKDYIQVWSFVQFLSLILFCILIFYPHNNKHLDKNWKSIRFGWLVLILMATLNWPDNLDEINSIYVDFASQLLIRMFSFCFLLKLSFAASSLSSGVFVMGGKLCLVNFESL